MGLIQKQSIIAPSWHAHTVVRPRNRCEIYNKQKIFLGCFVFSYEAENTAVSIVGIDPLKTVPVIVQPEKCRIAAVQMEKIADIHLKVLVVLLFGQIPVQSHLLIPFVPLAEILSHKQELLSGMSQHKGISGF